MGFFERQTHGRIRVPQAVAAPRALCCHYDPVFNPKSFPANANQSLGYRLSGVDNLPEATTWVPVYPPECIAIDTLKTSISYKVF